MSAPDDPSKEFEVSFAMKDMQAAIQTIKRIKQQMANFPDERRISANASDVIL